MINPVKLTPILCEKIWGGCTLSDRYAAHDTSERIGEAWMLCCRRDISNVTASDGTHGKSLFEYLSSFAPELLHSGDFPLIIKLIDAHSRLSVQVHPDDEYAAATEGQRGKSELWYVISAEPGAEIVYGLQKGCTADDLRIACENGTVGDVLNYVPVSAGDMVFIPSGQVHAIGSGIVIAEIQECSFLTYRLYDYDRRDINGRARELHVEKALGCVRVRTEEQICSLACGFPFETNVYECGGTAAFCCESWCALYVISGGGTLEYGGCEYIINDGECILAFEGEYKLNGKMKYIEVRPKNGRSLRKDK